ncbi:MAG: hypothetical protein Q7R90_04305 [bacterium]|nr:hypothetical protein [bacterium]
MIESHWPKPSGEPHWGKKDANEKKGSGSEVKKPGPEIAKVDDEIAAMRAKFAARRAEINQGHNERIEELRAAGEAARKAAMENFDTEAATRAVEGQARVDAANRKLADSVEEARKKFPDIFK